MNVSLHFGARAYDFGHFSFIYFYKQHCDCTENFSTLSFQPHQYNLRLAAAASCGHISHALKYHITHLFSTILLNKTHTLCLQTFITFVRNF